MKPYHKNPHTGVVTKCIYGNDCPLDPKHRGDYHFETVVDAYEFKHDLTKRYCENRQSAGNKLVKTGILEALLVAAAFLFGGPGTFVGSAATGGSILLGMYMTALAVLYTLSTVDSIEHGGKLPYSKVGTIPERLPEDTDERVQRAEYISRITLRTPFDESLLKLSTGTLEQLADLPKYKPIKSEVMSLLAAPSREQIVKDLREADEFLVNWLSNNNPKKPVYLTQKEFDDSFNLPITEMDDFYLTAGTNELYSMLPLKQEYARIVEILGYNICPEKLSQLAKTMRECYEENQFPVTLTEKDYENDVEAFLAEVEETNAQSIVNSEKTPQKAVYDVPEGIIPDSHKERIKKLLTKQATVAHSSYRVEQVPVYLTETLRAFAALSDSLKTDPQVLSDLDASISVLERIVGEAVDFQSEQSRNALTANRIFLEGIDSSTALKVEGGFVAPVFHSEPKRVPLYESLSFSSWRNDASSKENELTAFLSNPDRYREESKNHAADVVKKDLKRNTKEKRSRVR